MRKAGSWWRRPANRASCLKSVPSVVSPALAAGQPVDPMAQRETALCPRIRGFPTAATAAALTFRTGHLNGRSQPACPARRHCHGPRRRRPDDQGRGQEDRRRAGRRPGAQRAAGVRGARRARAAGGLGGRRRFAEEQADPGAGGAGDQPLLPGGGHAAADARRPLPVLRGGRKAGPQVAAPGRRDAARHAEQLAPLLADPAVDLVAWKPTRSRARSAPTSFSRPRSSSSRSAPSPTSPLPPRSRCCRASAC
jgi:hypothetical protein